MSASLKEILQAPGDAPEKAEKLKEWTARHVEKADVAALGHFIPELLDESVPLSLSRPAISEWAGSVLDIPESRGVENEDPKLPHYLWYFDHLSKGFGRIPVETPIYLSGQSEVHGTRARGNSGGPDGRMVLNKLPGGRRRPLGIVRVLGRAGGGILTGFEGRRT
ncbi:hypothetical protein DIPPA_13450 [Diplonema papillatum]|nr:hypothetical protein DIPPA_13450 [Diplonema papillatum]